MTPVTDTALDQLHAAATSIFTGALEASSIETAFDRRLRFEGNVLHRLLPDGSGPETINLSNYKRIFVIAIGKAAEPMLETLLDRMKRRKGLRGICCSTQIPKTRNWRIRYFLGGHPLPNEDSFESARAALALLKKARKDTLVFFLVSGGGSAMFDLPLDPQITLEDAIVFNQALIGSGAPINEINTLRKHFSAVKGGRLAIAAPEAAKVSLLLPDVPLRSLDALASGPTTPDRSTVGDVRDLIARYHLEMKFPPSVRKFFDRDDLPESPGNKSLPSIAGWRPPFMPRMPWSDPPPAPARRITSASAMSGEDDAFRDSVYEVLLSSHDLVESARIQAQKLGYFVAIDNSCDDWDYADAARYLLERFHHLRLSHPRLCLLSGGGRSTVIALSRSPRRGRTQSSNSPLPARLSSSAKQWRAHHRSQRRLQKAALTSGNTRAAGAIADPPPPSRAPAPSDFNPRHHSPTSTPVRSLRLSVIPSSPAPPATIFAISAFSSPSLPSISKTSCHLESKLSSFHSVRRGGQSGRICGSERSTPATHSKLTTLNPSALLLRPYFLFATPATRRFAQPHPYRRRIIAFTIQLTPLGFPRGPKRNAQSGCQDARHSHCGRPGQGLHRHRLQNHQRLSGRERAALQARLAGHPAVELLSQHPCPQPRLRPQPPVRHHR